MSTMTPSQIELARKLVGHGRWEWRAGIRETQDSRFMRVDEHTGEEVWSVSERAGVPGVSYIWPSHRAHYLPDLTDDATAGVLLGMWREVECYPEDGVWTVIAELEDKMQNMGDNADELATHLGELLAILLLDAWSTP